MSVRRPIVAVLWLVWAALPFVAGPAFAAGLDSRSAAVQRVASAGLWAGWAVVLVALLVRSTASLTVARLGAPAPLVGAVLLAWSGPTALENSAAIAAGVIVAALASSAEVGAVFVGGSAYGDEKRFALKPPAAMVLGPLPIGWCVAALGLTAGPLLLACRSWVAGIIATVVGVPIALAIARRLHALSRRWLVLVPAGVVVHDQVVLADTALFPRATIVSVGLAAADTDATDLTAGAPGLALEIRLREPATVVAFAAAPPPEGARRSARRMAVPVETPAVLCSPSRPGAVLAALERG